MEILIEELYKQDLHVGNFVERKVQLNDTDTQLCGTAQSGKTQLIKHALLHHKKSSYLYLDLHDVRIDDMQLNSLLQSFINRNEIDLLALDNYRDTVRIPKVKQCILAAESMPVLEGYEQVRLYPLDFEEFLAFEHKFDSTALHHYLQTGGYPGMHTVASDKRVRYLQSTLRNAMSEIGFSIMLYAARSAAQKVSAFNIYERLKTERKISKDKLYRELDSLIDKQYLYMVAKHNHPRTTKKLYLCDIAIKNALTLQKHFGRLFENLIALELIKHGHSLYYDEGIEFYLPEESRAIICMPFSNKDMLFKRIEGIEAFLITNNVTRVEAVTMSSEGELHHPFVDVEMIPFARWALVDE